MGWRAFLRALYAHNQVNKSHRGVEGNINGCLTSINQDNQANCHEPRCSSAHKRLPHKRHPHRRTRKFRIEPEKTSQIFKIGNVELTQVEENILNRGLSFIPTPCGPLKKTDVEGFKRRLRLKEYFLHLPPSNKHPFKLHSDFEKNRALEKYLTEVEGQLDLVMREPEKINTNMTVEERKALKSLKGKQNMLVIKKADKGSTITVTGIERYIADGETHLSDDRAYRKLEVDWTAELANRVQQFILQIHEVGGNLSCKYMKWVT